MARHDIEGLEEVQASGEEHREACAYVTICVAEPFKTIRRLAWTPAAFAEAGYCDAADTVEGLPFALVRFVSREATIAATAGQPETYRVRLYPPKGGNTLAQHTVKAIPIDEVEGELYNPAAPVDPVVAARRDVAAAQREVGLAYRLALDILRGAMDYKDAAFRQVIQSWQELSTAQAVEAREGRENTRALFEHHIKREIGLVDADRKRLEAERQIVQAEREANQEGSIADELGGLAMRLLAAAKDLPPELGELMNDSPEIIDMIRSNPAAIRKLRDPAARVALMEILSSLPDLEQAA